MRKVGLAREWETLTGAERGEHFVVGRVSDSSTHNEDFINAEILIGEDKGDYCTLLSESTVERAKKLWKYVYRVVSVA